MLANILYNYPQLCIDDQDDHEKEGKVGIEKRKRNNIYKSVLLALK